MVYNLLMAEGMKARDKKVRLYALSTCPICSRVKKFLTKHGVECETIDVDLLPSGEQWATGKEVKRYNPKATYPTLVIEEVITDFDEQAIREALGIDDA